MKRLISLRDLREMKRQGKDLRAMPENPRLTPSALAFLRKEKLLPGRSGAGAPATSSRSPRVVTAHRAKPRIEAFFNSPALHELKQQVCDIGRRMWQRAYVEGNGGNMAIKVAPRLVLCTPTLLSKGFMTPEDLCLVDLDGNQVAGARKRTSEILMHLQIMKRQPRAKFTAHCHPPCSIGFSLAGIQPPTGLVSEFELFVSATTAPYRTPGSTDLGRQVAALADTHNTILMAHHGVVSWSHLSLEDAYFKVEILEGYCQTLLTAAQLGRPAKTISPRQMQALLRIKRRLGVPDPRHNLDVSELLPKDQWLPGDPPARHTSVPKANRSRR